MGVTPVFIAFGRPVPAAAATVAWARRELLDLGERAFHERTAAAILVLLAFMIVMNAAAIVLSGIDADSSNPTSGSRKKCIGIA